jgi:hypothetical protein
MIKIPKAHILQHGRHPLFRVWRGPGDRDSSDKEWEEQFWQPTAPTLEP